MKLKIRKETPHDYREVFELTGNAYAGMPKGWPTKRLLLSNLRHASSFNPELSLVAENINGEVVGHTLLTEVTVGDDNKMLSMALLSIHPDFRRQGVGAALLGEAHHRTKELGYSSIVLIGEEEYFPRFGYRPMHEYGIEVPFDVPKERCMVVELEPDALTHVAGVVKYPDEYYDLP